MEVLTKLYDAVVAGVIENAGSLARLALDSGIDAATVLNRSLLPAMEEVGARFERSEYYIPDMLIASQAMKNAMAVLDPVLARSGVEPLGSVVMGTVKGDLHDIGKNLVASLLEGNGFQVLDLGMDVSAERFVTAIKANKVDIAAMSALLSTSMLYMKEVIDALEREGLRNRVKIIVGGAPVTQAFAEEIGADGYSDNANGAVILAKQLVPGLGDRS